MTRSEFETILLRDFAGNDPDNCLEPYHQDLGREAVYFKWTETNGYTTVTFRPRIIMFKMLLSWLERPYVADIVQVSQSALSQNLMKMHMNPELMIILRETKED